MVVDEVISQKAFEQQKQLDEGFQKNIANLAALAETASSIKFNIGDAKVFSEINTQLKTLSTLTVEVSKVTKEQLAISKQKADLDAKESRAALAKEKQKQQEIKTKQQEIKLENDILKQKEKVEKQTIKESKAQVELINDYKLLVKAQQEASLRYKNLALNLGENHELTIQAREDANAMRDVIVKLDAGVQEYGKNVGNYNAVGAQFNQLLREAPNAAISFRTFLISLTNNITYFFEAIKNARAAGQSWMQILGSMGKSLFGVVGIVNLAIVAIGFLGQKIAESGSNAVDAKSQIDKFNSALKETIELQQKRKQLDKATTGNRGNIELLEEELRLLQAQQAPVEDIFNKQTQIYNERLALIDDEAKRYALVTNALRDYQQAIQAPNATMKDEINYRKDLINVLVTQGNLTRDEANKTVNTIVNNYDLLQSQIDDYLRKETEVAIKRKKLQTDYQVDTTNYQQALSDEIQKRDDEDEKAAEEARKRRKKQLDELMKQQALTGNLTFRNLQTQIQNDNVAQETIFNNQQNSLDKRMSALDFYLANELQLIEAEKKKELETEGLTEQQKQLIIDYYRIKNLQAVKDYDNKVKEIQKTSLDQQYQDIVTQYNNIETLRLERLNKELLTLQTAYKKGNISFEQYQKQRSEIVDGYEEQVYQQQVTYLQDALSNFKGTAEQKAQLQAELNDILNEHYQKDADNQKDAEEKKKKQMQATISFAQKLIDIQQQAYNSENERNNRLVENARDQRDEFERNAQLELDRIARTEKDEEEKNKKIAEAEARLFTQREALQQREREAKNKAARNERANNIALIIQRTQLAIITAFTEGDPYTKLLRAAAAAVTGGSALASALATDVPQYKHGTTNHKGNLFVAGDGNERELVVPSDGSAPYLTDDKPTLYNEPKGTHVYNQEQMRKLAQDAMTPYMVKAISGNRKKSSDSDMAKIIADEIHKSTDKQIRAIKRSRSTTVVHVDSNDRKFSVNTRTSRHGHA